MDLLVNGTARTIAADADTPLLWVLREQLGLTGTKYGCGIGVCGACMVHLNGAAVPSCTLPVAAVAGAAVTTIEGIADGDRLHPLQLAWLDADVSQCGYCQPGFIMAALALLKQGLPQSDTELAARLPVLCRCGTYPRVQHAIRSVPVP
jgi:isoquinoline 1-oxidoreductase alpha subunit